MADVLDSSTLRTCLLLMVAALCGEAWRRELARLRRDGIATDEALPAFWLWAGALLAALALALALDLPSVLRDQVRRSASSDGWYSARRPLQALVIVVGLVAVVAAGRRGGLLLPSRRRRYLIPALTLGAILLTTATRSVSLHEIDAIYYRASVTGARLGSLIEISLTLVMAALAVRRIDGAGRRSDAAGVRGNETADAESVSPSTD
ncbi:hypothetical protein [Ilumatobacter sp.]|uniref:hypothetical protein n=1 Tax=Ilumatobacter sp. TaxID=1967498 RepID=UPI003B5244F2